MAEGLTSWGERPLGGRLRPEWWPLPRTWSELLGLGVVQVVMFSVTAASSAVASWSSLTPLVLAGVLAMYSLSIQHATRRVLYLLWITVFSGVVAGVATRLVFELATLLAR